MSVSETDGREAYAGNGVTTAFSFPHHFKANADLAVYLVTDSTGAGVLKTITTHYTVTGAGVAAGGTVTMVTAPATGETLVIYADPDIEQETTLEENGTRPAATLIAAWDLLTMICRRLGDRVDRAIRLPDYFTSSFSMVLPDELEAETLLMVNEDGDGWTTVDIDDVVDNLMSEGELAITNAMSATSVTDATVDAASYSSAEFIIEIIRSTTIFMQQSVFLFRRNGAWELHEGNSVGAGDSHGLTWSVTESGGIAQLKVASDSSGTGSIKWKRRVFDA